jgi:hypothetical protein
MSPSLDNHFFLSASGREIHRLAVHAQNQYDFRAVFCLWRKEKTAFDKFVQSVKHSNVPWVIH